MSERRKEDFSFEIIEHICIISDGRQEGYTKELNYVAFNGKAPKWDIREWNSDHTKMTKGLTFTSDEIQRIAEAVNLHIRPDEDIYDPEEETA
ncbi:MAG: PC4/YdbC family ssDNA-binding protein [Eubacteriales bacterium]|nr:PC4/YdbC family ssDNA-binding protein [Eubacteriales bacterium]MDD4389984.1 PC4/YdbC family ssDNA-binding protein [Eubacteriales bacterium]